MRQFRLNILRLHRMKRQTSDKCTELRLRLLIICTLELRRDVIILIAVVVVIQIGTMWREGLQFVKSAVFHLRLLRLGNVFLFLNKDRSFIWPDFVVLSRVCQWLNMQGALHVVHWNILRRFYSEIQYLASEELLRQLLLLQVCQRTRFFWIGDGTPWLSGLHCVALTALRIGQRLHTDLSSKGGVKILPGIALRDQSRCTVLISPSIVCGRAYFDVLNDCEWTDRSCSFDLTEYHLWKVYFWMFLDALWSKDHFMTLNEHNRHCGCTRLVL